ncbi:MAG TPA: NADH-quinone oxidoreductase subunit C [Methanoregulaceae archaeon]|nr:NADH-quinone oxidoreductase subunit C [Methanoregulaceae archaeon]HRY75545.1 NADH-quinone oxidoreductase subunit C [Methanoregulaceae archaeon]
MAPITSDHEHQLRGITGAVVPPDRLVCGPAGEFYLVVSREEFEKLAGILAVREYALISMFCAEDLVPTHTTSLLYVFEKRGGVLVLVTDADTPVPSLALRFPSASWFERECRDGFGNVFTGAPDTRRLLFHEAYPDGFHPLKKSFRNAPIVPKPGDGSGDEYPFRTVLGEGVYQVPVGPVHAGIIEPGHFRFSVIGETIFNLEIRMFYKHRGIEKLAEGKDPKDCVRVAEAVSGDESVANAAVFCMGVERITGIAVPDRAWYIRTILMEMERICSHLGDQAGMLTDVAFPLGASQFSVLREEVFRQNASLSGSRFLRGMIVPGGLARDISPETLASLETFLTEFRKRYRIGLRIVLSTASVVDRFTGTGVLKQSLLLPLNITGPVARASGSRADVRTDRPYGVYAGHAPSVHPLSDGDVLSRFTVRAAEIMDSIDLILRIIHTVPAGEVRTEKPVRDGYALTLVEAPRGQNLAFVRIRNGVVDRYKVRTASFCNWQAIEHAVLGNIIADFPLINKSLNLSYAGTDL